MPKRFGLRLAEWPAADCAAWGRAIIATDYFDDEATAAGWRPKTRASAASAYGRWLSYLKYRRPASLQQPLDTRLNEQVVSDYAKVLAARMRAMSVASELNHLALALTAMAPNIDWKWLRSIQSAWQRRAQRRDLRPRMVHPARLLALGLDLMETAESAGNRIAGARQYRDGLLIALLACRPLRRRTLCAVEIGRHLRRTGDRYVLAIPGEDMKSGVAIEFDVPDELNPYLMRYIDVHRQAFPGAARTPALWMSSMGGALGDDAVYDLVSRRTRAAFGFSVNPHLFRHIAATAIARESPESVATARDLLTHANLDTTASYYLQATTSAAAKTYAAILDALRSRTSHGQQ